MDKLKITCELSPFYMKRFKDLADTKGLNQQLTVEYLLDYYYLDNSLHLVEVYKQLSIRLFKGVDRSFIIQLRNMYTAIGHFLKRLRYL